MHLLENFLCFTYWNAQLDDSFSPLCYINAVEWEWNWNKRRLKETLVDDEGGVALLEIKHDDSALKKIAIFFFGMTWKMKHIIKRSSK